MNDQADDNHGSVKTDLFLDEISMLREASSAVGMNINDFIGALTQNYLRSEGRKILKYFNNIEESLNSVEIER